MGTGTVDECVRQLILVGSNPDKIGLLDNFCMATRKTRRNSAAWWNA